MSAAARNLPVDALRGLAAVAVLLTHFLFDYQAEHGHQPATERAFRDGRFGVMLFFMISGYVIFFTAERRREVGAFVRARIARLFPVYWTAILVTLALFQLEPRLATALESRKSLAPLDAPTTLLNVTMLQEFFAARHVADVFWTLHVELCFYALVAFCLLCRRVEAVTWALLAGVLVDLALTARGIVPEDWPQGWARAAMVPFKHWHCFLLGLLIVRRDRLPRPAAFAMAALCLVCAWLHEDRSAAAKTGALALALLLAVQGRLPFLAWRPLVFLGTISYSLYLVHRTSGMAAMLWLYDRGWGTFPWVLLPGAAAAIALASAMTFLVERPAQRWLSKRRTPPAPAVSE